MCVPACVCVLTGQFVRLALFACLCVCLCVCVCVCVSLSVCGYLPVREGVQLPSDHHISVGSRHVLSGCDAAAAAERVCGRCARVLRRAVQRRCGGRGGDGRGLRRGGVCGVR